MEMVAPATIAKGAMMNVTEKKSMADLAGRRGQWEKNEYVFV
jgi:hypothetical protein